MAISGLYSAANALTHIIFGVAKGLNAAISMAQGTHFQKLPSNKAKDKHYDKHNKKDVDSFSGASATYWVDYHHEG